MLRVSTGRCLVFILGFLLLSASLLAQSGSGSITGTVTDASGSPLPGATISARNLATNATRTTVSTSTGTYNLPLLPAGSYEVTADLSGFSFTRFSSIEVNVASSVTLDVSMRMGIEESVTVTADAPLIETTRSEVSSVVGEKLVANLPVNGRNFLDFALTTPGVVRDVRQGDLSFAGQRGTLNSLVVDGANNDNTFFGQALGRTGTGRAPYQFSQDAVREFQVNSSSYSAEYGRAGGAVINVITKSGTNEFDGTGFYFLRDRDFNENDFINEINNRAKGPYHFDQYGASLGGPIVRDRHFFFVNYDAQRNTIPNLVVLNLAGTTPDDADTRAGLATLRSLGNSYERGQDQDVFFVKTDHELFRSHLSLRFNRQEFTGVNFENGGITNAEEHTGNSVVETDTLSGNFITPVSASLFNEFRGQWAEDHEPGEANSARPEATIRQNGQTVLVIGRNFFSPRETTIERWQVADTVNFLTGSHSVKAGFDVSNDDILNFFPGNFSGSYTFDSIAAFQRGVPSRYVQAFAGPGTSGPTTNPNIRETAAFIQEEWRVSPSFTINAGLRYDLQSIDQGDLRNPNPELAAAGIDTSLIPEDDDNIGLRLGLAYSPGATGRTVIRGGYGTFHGRTPAIMIGTAHSNNGINVQTITFTGSQVPTYPNTFASIPTGASIPKPTILVFNRDFENPTVHQASIGVERALTNDLSVGLSYQYVKGEDLPRSADINVGGPTEVTTPIAGGGSGTYRRYTTRPFQNFGRIIEFQSSADSEYNGVTLSLGKRFSGNWLGSASYTYSTAKDNRPDATAVVPAFFDDVKYAQDPFDLDGDWAYSDSDVRHRAVLSGVWNLDYADGLPFGFARAFLTGWTLSGIATYQTGQPYSAIINTDLNNDGNSSNDRAPGFERNSFRLPDFFSVDPRITRVIPFGRGLHLQLIAEAFNVFNESNVSGERRVFYSLSGGQLVPQTNFGSPTQSAGPRIVQFAAKFVY